MMRPNDFFVTEEQWGPDTDPWSASATVTQFDAGLIEKLRRGPTKGQYELEIAVALAQLADDELRAYGTVGNPQLEDAEVAAAILALRAVLRRLGIEFDLPFRNFTGWRTYWLKNDGYRSWQSRQSC